MIKLELKFKDKVTSARTSITQECQDIDNLNSHLCQDIDNPAQL